MSKLHTAEKWGFIQDSFMSVGAPLDQPIGVARPISRLLLPLDAASGCPLSRRSSRTTAIPLSRGAFVNEKY
jgi:hypothetical protein|nr:hypothetical protein Q903MT_gene702 [Picea sitchensis]